MRTTSHPSSAITRLSPRMERQDAIEWEDLPSLADSLAKRLAVMGTREGEAAAPVWVDTVAARLEPMLQSEPFREALQGLQTRELHEPEVFRVFFGDRVIAA